MSTFDWEKIWFSEETITEARQTLVEALYIALSPGSLPSACVFAFDCFLTVVHFVVSSYILDDFTTTFLGTVYFPTTFLKIVYIIDCIASAEWILEVNEILNQIFNMTIILSCIAYNFMCLFVAQYRKNIPLPVCRTVFAPILLFCSFLVIAPKLVMDRYIDNCFQFTTQLFGTLFLIAQISWNMYTFVCRKVDTGRETKEVNSNDDVTAANDVIRNANGRLVWASWFSLIIVILAIPQIIDYYVPLTTSWIPYHFMVQSLVQLNALLLSFTIFLILPTYRSVIFSCCINYNRIIKVEEIKIEKENTDTPEKRSKKELEKEAEALANHQQIHPSPHQNISIPHFRHVAIPRIRVPVIPPIVAQPTGQIRIFVAPPQKKY
ncbi:hypothetical protein GCK72_014081 [Caenorhabditis remanei]|uniref:Uncharacterized protein n=1 Tax=Caenorhabditis remanei TaxID=31234 RepID=A0A6A5GT04_CAERE|nr:hypothetical protein GCK72_014081 [Caenorhabditis remanei]KAF1757625.1 hypothetical protein GCK72_014081 [Caenorhabditis remanei]